MALQYWQLTGHPERRRFVAFRKRVSRRHAWARRASAGSRLFHDRFADWQFPVVSRRIAGRARRARRERGRRGGHRAADPGRRGDAALAARHARGSACAGAIAQGVLLILDEVMTGFGRTGTMFACEQEGSCRISIALAKGLTGGYLPLAATLTTRADLRGVPLATARSDVLLRPQLYRQSARLRGGAGESRDLSRRSTCSKPRGQNRLAARLLEAVQRSARTSMKCGSAGLLRASNCGAIRWRRFRCRGADRSTVCLAARQPRPAHPARSGTCSCSCRPTASPTRSSRQSGGCAGRGRRDEVCGAA